MGNFFLYLAVMAGVTYMVRMLPLVLVRRKIENRFVLSFLCDIPHAGLSGMAPPAPFSATVGGGRLHRSAGAVLLRQKPAAGGGLFLPAGAGGGTGSTIFIRVLYGTAADMPQSLFCA